MTPNSIADRLNLSIVGEFEVKGKIEYDVKTQIFIFEDGSKAKQYSGISVLTQTLYKYWKEVK
jgi:hypothetical protein